MNADCEKDSGDGGDDLKMGLFLVSSVGGVALRQMFAKIVVRYTMDRAEKVIQGSHKIKEDNYVL